MATIPIILPIEAGNPNKFVTNSARYDQALNALLFSATQTESKVFTFEMPSNFVSTVTIRINYTMVSATSGKVDWEVDVMAVTPTDAVDMDTASFDSINEIAGGDTVPGTAGQMGATVVITLSNLDGLSAGDVVFFRISRDHDDADDTATGDAEIRTLLLTYDNV